MDIYMDEAGTDLKHPVLTVAAVLINPNKQVKMVEQRMEEIRATHPLLKDIPNFYFHAKDVMNNRRWTREQGLEIIGKYIGVIYDCGLTAVIHWGSKKFIDAKKSAELGKTFYSKREQKIEHVGLFVWSLSISNMIIENVYPDDIGSVFAEDCGYMNELLRKVTRAVKDKGSYSHHAALSEIWKGGFHHIKNGISFCAKQDCAALQIADACAYAMNRYITQSEGGDYLYHCIQGKPEFEIRRNYSTDGTGYIIRSFTVDDDHWDRLQTLNAASKLDHSVFVPEGAADAE